MKLFSSQRLAFRRRMAMALKCQADQFFKMANRQAQFDPECAEALKSEAKSLMHQATKLSH